MKKRRQIERKKRTQGERRSAMSDQVGWGGLGPALAGSLDSDRVGQAQRACARIITRTHTTRTTHLSTTVLLPCLRPPPLSDR